jgi:pimeloyl-ACP methyl ester carboxylesterase
MNAAGEAGYHGYALSLRGHGGSDGTLWRATMGDYVADVLRTAGELPAALGARRAHRQPRRREPNECVQMASA